MKEICIIIFIISQSICFSQNNVRPFVNPVETAPRFVEDINLSEAQNKKKFNKRIQSLFTKHFDYLDSPFINDSIKTKVNIKFSIDSLGRAKFYDIKPKKIISNHHVEELSKMINSLPKFIPAKQRNKSVMIKYHISIYSKNYFLTPK